MRQALRPSQERGIAEVRSASARGKRRVLLVAPTGAGKTTIAAELIHGAVKKQSRTVFLAHRRELIGQCSKRLDQWEVPHGVVQAAHWRWAPHLPVQVASVQSLRNRLQSGAVPADARLLIIDESHRALAPTYQEIVQAHEGVAVIGLTATPIRQDGRGLGALYDELVLVAQPGELVADGFLVEPTVYAGAEADLSGISVQRGDYVEAQLAAVMDRPKLVGDVVGNFLRLVGRGRRTAVFAVSVEHSQHLAETFRAQGVPAAHIDGTTPADQRDEILLDLTEGRLEVVCNCGILTEGWDLPALDAVVLARPTKSVALYLQCVGRVLRPHPGKERALVLDHGANVRRLGWPTAPREWSLEEGITKAAKSEVAAVKNCPKCGAVALATTQACGGCGFEWSPADREPMEVVDGALAQVTADQAPPPPSRSAMLNALTKWVAIARRQNMKTARNGFPGFAAYKFKESYNRWPTADEMITSMERARHVRAREVSTDE